MWLKEFYRCIACCLVLFGSGISQAQYIKIGDGAYSGSLGGPMNSNTVRDTQVSQFAYIFPKSVLGNLYNKDTITSVEFFHLLGAAPNSNTQFTLWIQNTSRNDFGMGKLHFSTETKNSILVFSGSPANYIGKEEKFYRLPLNVKPFEYDSVKGENIAIFAEYKQTQKQTVAFQWYFEGAASVSGYSANQVKYAIGLKATDSLPSSSSYHPTIILNFPKIQYDLAINKVYTLGKIPLPLGRPDSVKALIRNVGKHTLKNFRVFTRSQGFNKQKDSFLIDLLPGEESLVRVPSLLPSNSGLDTVYVECNDKNASNNTGSSYRLGNANVYSYRDVNRSPASGGIGFNATNGDFVAKFTSNQPKYINQVTVSFGAGGQPFRVAIWSHDSTLNKPRSLIYQSDSLTSKTGNYILDLKKPVPINRSFYVGVRQLGKNNVSFGYQIEEPVRPGTFFYAEPLGDTNWLDFSPGAPFKFLIEPRIQADIDIASISADNPKDSINQYTTDTLAPEGVVGNIGVKDAKDSFEIRCEIWNAGSRLYKNTIRDTLSSGIKRKYVFPKTFFPKSFGEHLLMIIAKKSGDKIVDNDTQIRKFYVGVKKDVMVASVYEPTESYGYTYKTDTLMPLANILNVGYDNTPSFSARCKIFQGSKLVYNQVQFLSLPKFQSKIVYWPTYKCGDTGKLKIVFITGLAKDAYTKNDTQTRNFYVRKLVDIGIDSLRSPDPLLFHTKGKALKLTYYVYNDGLIPAFNVPFYCSIFDPSGKLLYYDSSKAYLQGLFGSFLTMNKTFTPGKLGLYKIVLKTHYYLDLFGDNDSLVEYFNVGKPYDFEAIRITNPKTNDSLSLGNPSISPKVLVRNNGYLKNTAPVVCEIFYAGNRLYFDSKNSTLDTGKSDTVVFSQTFRPVNVGMFSHRTYTNLGSDVMRSNDTLMSLFYGVVGKDAFPVSVWLTPDNKPFDANDSIKKIGILVQNQGADSIRKVLVAVSIFEGAERTFYQSKVTQIEGSGKDTVLFDSQHAFNKIGDFSVSVLTTSYEDQNIFNDTLSFQGKVELLQDIGLVEAQSPNGKTPIVLGDSIRHPKIKFKNWGLVRNSKKNRIVYRISKLPQNGILFSDTFSIGELISQDSAWIASQKPLVFSEPGAYLLKIFLLNSLDGNTHNDTLSFGLLVETNTVINGKAIAIKVFPNPATKSLTIIGSTLQSSWKLLDLCGNIVGLGEIKSPYFGIDVEYLAAGMYILTLQGPSTNSSFPIAIQEK